MKNIPDIQPYIFLHQNKDGYIVGIQRGIGVYFVVVMDSEGDLISIPTYGQEYVQYLYETIYRWLAYRPTDVARKCIKLRDTDNLPLALDQLPLAQTSITIPDLKQLEFEDFKRRLKK